MKEIGVVHSNKGIGVNYASREDQMVYDTIVEEVEKHASSRLIQWNMDEFKLEHPDEFVQENILNKVKIEFKN